MLEQTGTSTRRKERKGNWMRPIGRSKIAVELNKYTHLLNEQHPSVHNICNGQVAPDPVSVQDALAIGSEQSRQFSSNFHTTIKKMVKTMELIKKVVR